MDSLLARVLSLIFLYSSCVRHCPFESMVSTPLILGGRSAALLAAVLIHMQLLNMNFIIGIEENSATVIPHNSLHVVFIFLACLDVVDVVLIRFIMSTRICFHISWLKTRFVRSLLIVRG